MLGLLSFALAGTTDRVWVQSYLTSPRPRWLPADQVWPDDVQFCVADPCTVASGADPDVLHGRAVIYLFAGPTPPPWDGARIRCPRHRRVFVPANARGEMYARGFPERTTCKVALVGAAPTLRLKVATGRDERYVDVPPPRRARAAGPPL